MKIYKKIFILGLSLIGIILLLNGCNKSHQSETTQSEEQIVEAAKGDIKLLVQATGTFQPRTKIEVVAPKRGRMDKVFIREGDTVQKGQKLGFIISEEQVALLDIALADLKDAVRYHDTKKSKRAKKDLELINNTYKPISIHSPINGTVIFRGVEPGQTLSNDKIMFILADILIVKAQIDEIDIGKINVGQEAEIKIDAYQNKLFNGHITQIAYEAKVNDEVNYYDVNIKINSQDKIFKSGMSASVGIILLKRSNVIRLPREIILKQKDEYFVTKKEGENYQNIKVEIGEGDDKYYEIVDGVKEGDKFVINYSGEINQSQEKKSFELQHLNIFRK